MQLDKNQWLKEMGLLPAWHRRSNLCAVRAEPATDSPPPRSRKNTAPVAAAPMLPVHRPILTTSDAETNPPENVVHPSASQRERALSTLSWSELEAKVRDCQDCDLCLQRTQSVLGVGNRQAECLVIGEGPGAEEDAKGEPFVGPAGKLLDNMLAAIKLSRTENVYITNAVKCRPPKNRSPSDQEIGVCRPFLLRQIALIEPKIILLLGKSAASSVLGSQQSMASLRGRLHYYQVATPIPVVASYHPAYLLRNLPDKRKSWEDLLLFKHAWQKGVTSHPEATD